MPHVIVDTCTKDFLCIETCPTGCILPTPGEVKAETVTQLYINPEECLDCGACMTACPTDSIFPADALPSDKQNFAAKNAEFFR
jgi:ferredoxin--NADP+ reductase